MADSVIHVNESRSRGWLPANHRATCQEFRATKCFSLAAEQNKNPVTVHFYHISVNVFFHLVDENF